ATSETRALSFALLSNTDYMMLVMGGSRDTPNPSNEVDVYDHFTNSWSQIFSFLTARRNFAVDADVSCYMWLAGGYGSDGTPLSSIEFFCFPASTPSPTATITATPTAGPRVTPTPRSRPTPPPRP